MTTKPHEGEDGFSLCMLSSFIFSLDSSAFALLPSLLLPLYLSSPLSFSLHTSHSSASSFPRLARQIDSSMGRLTEA
jgi:hypothetical protein